MRSGKVRKRVIVADPIYKSKVVTRVVNKVMLHGKKNTAEAVVYGVLAKLNEDRKEAVRLFEEAVRNVMPIQEVRSRRVGGATYQVPMPVKHERAETLAVRWLVGLARGKKGKPMAEKLYTEIKNASENMGDAIKKKDDTHKMAEANRAFSHFAKY